MGEQHGQRGPHEYAWEISVIEFELTYIYIYTLYYIYYYIYNIILYIYILLPQYSPHVPHGFRMGFAHSSGTLGFSQKVCGVLVWGDMHGQSGQVLQQFDTKFGSSENRAQFIGYSYIQQFISVYSHPQIDGKVNPY